jgi:predicted SAM-dependent methyltransferase
MIKIHIGCGKRDFGNDWFHIDGANYPHVKSNDIYLKDFKDNSVDIIYASHLIEYFDHDEAVILLSSWYRVLKGRIRLAVPDFEAMARLYVSDPFCYPLSSFIGPLYGKMKLNNSIIYHRVCYDFESLSILLNCIGFKNVHRYDWRRTEHAHIDDHSQAYLPHMEKDKGSLISLNVEAIK